MVVEDTDDARSQSGVDATTASSPSAVKTLAASGSDGIGRMLQARRLELGLSPADIGAVVKLPARRIVALEEERWEELPDGPYLRGFLRNVARALQIDAEALLARVDTSLMRSRNPDSILVSPGPTHGVIPRRSGRLDDRRSSRSWVLGALIFALIAAGIAWSGTESFEHVVARGRALAAGTPAVAPTPAVAAAEEPVVPPAIATVTADASTPPAAPVADATTVPADAGTPSTPIAVAATPAATGRALRFHFREDSWVEVKAADGTVLLQRLNAAGSEQEIDGAAPFALIVGNARGVDLRFRGQPVDLAPYTRDQVARLTLS